MTTAEQTPALDAGNPFAEPSTLPYGLPDFAAIRDEHYRPAFEAGMAEHLAQVRAIATDLGQVLGHPGLEGRQVVLVADGCEVRQAVGQGRRLGERVARVKGRGLLGSGHRTVSVRVVAGNGGTAAPAAGVSSGQGSLGSRGSPRRSVPTQESRRMPSRWTACRRMVPSRRNPAFQAIRR